MMTAAAIAAYLAFLTSERTELLVAPQPPVAVVAVVAPEPPVAAPVPVKLAPAPPAASAPRTATSARQQNRPAHFVVATCAYRSPCYAAGELTYVVALVNGGRDWAISSSPFGPAEDVVPVGVLS